MTRIEVEPGVELHVQDVGSGPPVVLVPGWAQSHEVWDAQVRVLAPNHRVVAVDPRGQGRSDRPFGDYTIARHAADVAVVLRELDLRDAVMVGWSMGGFIALRATADNRDRIAKLALVGSNGTRLVSDDGFPHGLPADVVGQFLGGELTARPQYRRGATEQSLFAPDPATVQWLVADNMQTPSWAGAASMQGLVDADHRADLAALDLPVLLLHGKNDPLFPIDGSHWVAERLKDARVVEFDSCGHAPHIEATGQLNAALVEFVDAF
ncbi:alpha/beta hydrolase [Pseudonocardia xishanensis]|uniref:Alpha/beta fold hydrolase n=1 Tax=Pseudonocardia xishanensis TaxID=630995 RepID=A0ABP8RTI2_9PSEU